MCCGELSGCWERGGTCCGGLGKVGGCDNPYCGIGCIVVAGCCELEYQGAGEYQPGGYQPGGGAKPIVSFCISSTDICEGTFCNGDRAGVGTAISTAAPSETAAAAAAAAAATAAVY